MPTAVEWRDGAFKSVADHQFLSESGLLLPLWLQPARPSPANNSF
jgi:hypothetical protein